MRRKTFDSKGLDYVSELSLQNVKDLKTHILGIMNMILNYLDYHLKYFLGWKNIIGRSKRLG